VKIVKAQFEPDPYPDRYENGQTQREACYVNGRECFISPDIAKSYYQINPEHNIVLLQMND